MKFVKKPIVIEATQWNGGHLGVRAIEAMYPTLRTTVLDYEGGTVSLWRIGTLEGGHEVSVGDWIIKGVKGEFYPCKPDIFEMTYDLVKETE